MPLVSGDSLLVGDQVELAGRFFFFGFPRGCRVSRGEIVGFSGVDQQGYRILRPRVRRGGNGRGSLSDPESGGKLKWESDASPSEASRLNVAVERFPGNPKLEGADQKFNVLRSKFKVRSRSGVQGHNRRPRDGFGLRTPDAR